jgi:hypothetical protein
MIGDIYTSIQRAILLKGEGTVGALVKDAKLGGDYSVIVIYPAASKRSGEAHSTARDPGLKIYN